MSSWTYWNQRHIKAIFSPCFLGQLWRAVGACGGRRWASLRWCLHLLCGCRGKWGSRRLHRHLCHPGTGAMEIHIPAARVAGLWTSWGGQTAARHRCPQRREMEGDAWAVPKARSERGAGAGALEADRGTGVRSRSAGGRVTSPAWAQMALHMALPLPEPCPLRQHLRSWQGLAETLQSSLSPRSCLDLEGWWVCKQQAALPQSGEGYLVTFQKTVPTSLCPGMGDLPAPGKKIKIKTKHSGVPPPIPKLQARGWSFLAWEATAELFGLW